ncbi:M23 family metallopeptidase [Wolbachia endosymbiont of Tribolium confusum]|uniref:M23 family metallopeptidase n=1 Tax=Wolbachia endosymbiont of Tribolium confusum TaxID=214474 RepID=UPI001CF1940C|nr:M23 family metallopeptidase [Wolbachia endosymbiont of Tribolium confusum]MCA7010372.1 M23 family metallopeptidase [Wolbachia endosymbiont of Tribolium confusum]
MRLVILPLLCILPAYATETFAQKDYCHSSAQTLEIDCKQHAIQHFRLKNWIPVSSTEMTLTHSPVLFQDGIRKKKATESDRKLLFISSDIKSSFFDAGGLAPDTIMRLISIYKDYGVDFKKDIVPKSKLEVLCESNQKAEEKILYTSLITDKKAISLYHYESQSGKERYFNKEGVSLKSSEIFVSPLNGDFRISSNFGNRKHPIHSKIAFHKGVDYAAKLGTPIHATAEGVIEYIGKNGGYGNYIKIKHNNKYSTCYAHISKFSSDIKLGSKVKQGQIIAYVGSTGVATGPHLHYEVIYNGKHIDPLTIASRTEVKLPDRELREFKLFVSKVDEIISREGASEKAI